MKGKGREKKEDMEGELEKDKKREVSTYLLYPKICVRNIPRALLLR